MRKAFAIGWISLLLTACGANDPDLQPMQAQSVHQSAPRISAQIAQSEVLISGYRRNFTVSRSVDGVVTLKNLITSEVTSYPSTTMLVKFFDLHTSFDVDGDAGDLYRVYQAAFNRKPDLPGLGFWINARHNDPNATMLNIAHAFLDSDEFKRMYGSSPSADSYVTALYNNVLHRAPEQQGYEWWLDVVSGGHDRGDVLLGFARSDENKKNVNPTIANGFDYEPFQPTGPITPKFSSYENKAAAGQALGSQPLPSIAGDATAFGDFFHDGTYSIVTNTLIYDNTNPATASQFGSIHFFQRVNGAWVDNTPTLLKDTSGCIHPRKAVVADFNSDGKPDVFFACHGFDAAPYSGEQPRLLMSQEDGTYTNEKLPITCFCHAASAVDFKHDGYADIVLTDTTVIKKPFFLRNNKGTFTVDSTSLPDYLNGQALFSAELIDFNGDGSYDLWIGGNEPGATPYPGGMPSEIILNDTHNNFLNTKSYELPINPDYGLPLDIVYRNGKIYLLRTNIGGGPNNYGKSFYTTSVVQAIDFATMQSSTVYSHSGFFSNGMQWINWIIPTRSGVTAMNSKYNSGLDVN